MLKAPSLSRKTSAHVRDRCLCLHAQRAARVLARHFDKEFRSLGLTSGQFSLLMSLNQAEPPSIGSVAAVLAMDRTTLTAAMKPLERRGLIAVREDTSDRRSRRLSLTEAGRTLLAEAAVIWRKAHDKLEALLAPAAGSGLRNELSSIPSLLFEAKPPSVSPARKDGR